MKKRLVILLAAVSSLSAMAESSNAPTATAALSSRQLFWNDYRRGWHFYEDPVVEPEPAKEPAVKDPAPSAKPADQRPPEIVQFEKLQKQLEEFRNVAIMMPTEANVRRYLELENRVVKQASLFADVAQRVAWANPDLDTTAQGRPANVKALEVYNSEQLSNRVDTVAKLGKDHVLMFFFKSDCPYCHAFAPIVQNFSRRYNMKVMAISVDGGPIPGFEEFRRDNGIGKTLGVQSVPATFLAQPFTGQITTIGFGVLSESELLERITTVTSPAASDVNPAVTQTILTN